MAIDTVENRISYAGDGSTTVFTAPGVFDQAEDLTVILVNNVTGIGVVQTITTHYTVSGGNQGTGFAGGSITMVTAPAVGETLVIVNDPDLTQRVDLTENDSLPAEALEAALDRLTVMAQRDRNLIERSVKLPDGYSGGFNPDLPPIVVADSILGSNAAGDGLEWKEGLLENSVAVAVGTGLLAKNGSTATPRTLQGTANEIDVADGTGASADPTVGLADNPVIPGVEGMVLPSGTTAERPSVPQNGQMRYNSTLAVPEIYFGSAWHRIGFPAGAEISYPGATVPAGWLLCDGSEVSRETYAELFAAIGTAHGEGDGATTFNLPDRRGYFLRGRDAGAGRDPDAGSRTAMATGGNTGDAVGSVQNDATKRPNANFTTNTAGSHAHSVTAESVGDGGADDASVPKWTARSETNFGNRTRITSSAGNHSHTITGGGDAETRPKNAYTNFIIKA